MVESIMDMVNVLLHTCCAPCSVACIAALRAEGIEPSLFWYNPNIHPSAEYKNRRDTLFGYAENTGLKLIAEDCYGLVSFIAGLCAEPESSPGGCRTKADFEEAFAFGKRCAYCYRLRLEQTARTAKERGFDAFSTTLLISPYQNHELLRETAEDAARDAGIEFLYRDFRPRFREGQVEARSLGLYMQKYCGCIFSEEERNERSTKRWAGEEEHNTKG
jgi:predicted adenine nucleotide alpha hydrolase (AANH) superfamily ATPase